MLQTILSFVDVLLMSILTSPPLSAIFLFHICPEAITIPKILIIPTTCSQWRKRGLISTKDLFTLGTSVSFLFPEIRHTVSTLPIFVSHNPLATLMLSFFSFYMAFLLVSSVNHLSLCELFLGLQYIYFNHVEHLICLRVQPKFVLSFLNISFWKHYFLEYESYISLICIF